MRRRILCVLLVAVCALVAMAPTVAPSSDAVIAQGETSSTIYAIQQRLIDLGYLNYRATGKFSDMTREAVRKFQAENGLPADGQIGAETRKLLLSDSAKRQPMNPAFKSAIGRAYTGTFTQKGQLASWDVISAQFPIGATARVVDYNTGDSFNVRRTGGVNNAQVVTVSQEDTSKYEYVFGGYSWEHRPVLVEIGGTRYAASLFGMPTRIDSDPSSGMSGCTFLHFNSSRSDIFGITDDEHAVAITQVSV